MLSNTGSKNDTAPIGEPGVEDGRGSLTSRIHARLRADIISGDLEPGAKLKIEELRQRYKSGTSPIREALSLLTSDLLVERLDQRGFRVSPISVEQFDELFKTRCWLEERALRESIGNADKEWEEAVVLAAYRLARAPRSARGNQSDEWEGLHKDFHMTLLSKCGSRYLLNICDELYDQNVRYRMVARTKSYPERDVQTEHEGIADAVLARDEELAVTRLVEHYTNTGAFLRKHFD